MAARLTWWTACVRFRALESFPLDVEKIGLGAAFLQKEGYRTAVQNLYTLKRALVQLGNEQPQSWSLLLRVV